MMQRRMIAGTGWLRGMRWAIGFSLATWLLIPANAWAVRELVAFKDFTLFKINETNVDSWKQRIKRNGRVEFKCKQPGPCSLEVDAIGIGRNQNVLYTCDKGAKVELLPSGILMVPRQCDGVLKP